MVDKDPITSSINDYSSLLQTPHSDAFAFSETEQRVLQLYDQLQELGLQEGLIEAQVKGTPHRKKRVTGFSSNLLIARES